MHEIEKMIIENALEEARNPMKYIKVTDIAKSKFKQTTIKPQNLILIERKGMSDFYLQQKKQTTKMNTKHFREKTKQRFRISFGRGFKDWVKERRKQLRIESKEPPTLCERGSYAHEIIEERLKLKTVQTYQHLHGYWPNYTIIGTPDGIEANSIIEIKTTNKKERISSCKSLALKQANIYAWLFGKTNIRCYIYSIEEKKRIKHLAVLNRKKAVQNISFFIEELKKRNKREAKIESQEWVAPRWKKYEKPWIPSEEIIEVFPETEKDS